MTSGSQTDTYPKYRRSRDQNSSQKPDRPLFPVSNSINSNSQNKSRPAAYLARSPLERMKLAYYRYEVTYGLYMMDPSEKVAINLVIAILTCVILAVVIFYLPLALTRLLKRLIFYDGLTRPSPERMNATIEHLIANRVLSSPYPQVATFENQTWSAFRE